MPDDDVHDGIDDDGNDDGDDDGDDGDESDGDDDDDDDDDDDGDDDDDDGDDDDDNDNSKLIIIISPTSFLRLEIELSHLDAEKSEKFSKWRKWRELVRTLLDNQNSKLNKVKNSKTPKNRKAIEDQLNVLRECEEGLRSSAPEIQYALDYGRHLSEDDLLDVNEQKTVKQETDKFEKDLNDLKRDAEKEKERYLWLKFVFAFVSLNSETFFSFFVDAFCTLFLFSCVFPFFLFSFLLLLLPLFRCYSHLFISSFWLSYFPLFLYLLRFIVFVVVVVVVVIVVVVVVVVVVLGIVSVSPSSSFSFSFFFPPSSLISLFLLIFYILCNVYLTYLNRYLVHSKHSSSLLFIDIVTASHTYSVSCKYTNLLAAVTI